MLVFQSFKTEEASKADGFIFYVHVFLSSHVCSFHPPFAH